MFPKHLFSVALVAFCHQCHCAAFLNRPPGRSYGGSNRNGGIKPPQSSNHPQPDWDDADLSRHPLVAQGKENVTDHIHSNRPDMRGGSSSNVLKGTKTTLASTTSYWSNAFDKAGKAVILPFRAVKNKVASVMESGEQKADRELVEKMQKMKIQGVALPKTSVVPKEVIQLAARRSGLIGNPLRTDRVQEFAASLKRWYQMRGYILHTVVGANLNAETATAEIQVEEPTVSQQPVDITFCKEMVVDEETGNILTYRQYKERHMKRRTVGAKEITKAATNTTFVQTAGKTRPSRIADALGLEPGHPFQWDATKWALIARSGVFGRILQVGPARMRDGSAQLQILATEAPPRHLEYGVSKSLYTGSWEGEVDFQHENLLGGGESLGLMVRRGTKDPEPSVRVRFCDDKFGMPGGYDVEAFSDFIGDQPANAEKKKKEKQEQAEDDAKSDPNKMLDRRGIKFTYRNPIDPRKVLHSTASTSLERTATQSGIREAIGSGTLALGPFRRQLPLEARSSVDGSVTSGLRIPESTSKTESASGSSFRGVTLMPYSSFTITTTQVLPLLVASMGGGAKPSLALRHSLTGSTRNLPRHEQNAMGFASMIRGGNPNGRISTSVTGTTELRIPLQLDVGIPAIKSLQRNASFVVFGDWVSTRKNSGSSFSFGKSIGVGIRKNMQGLPLKLDISYAGNGKIKSNFGLGRDFDV